MKNKKIKILLWSSICLSSVTGFGKTCTINNINSIKKKCVEDYTYRNGTKDYSVNGMGMGINLASANSLSLKSSIKQKNILNPDLLNKIKDKGNALDINESYVELTEAENVTDLAIAIAAKYEKTLSGSSSNKLVSGDMDKSLRINGKVSFSQKKSQYYKIIQAVSERYSYDLSLTDYSIVTNEITNYDSGFIRDLNSAYSSNNFDSLFNKYGSHLITAGTYGGIYYATTSIATNKVNVGVELGVSYDSNTKVSSKKLKTSATESFSFDVEAQLGLSLSNEEKSFSASAIGGATIADLSWESGDIKEFESAVTSSYSQWAESLDSNIVLMSINDTIPLWEILPSNYNRSKMETAFNNFYNKYKPSYSFYTYTQVPTLYLESSTYATNENGSKVKYDNVFGNYIMNIQTDKNPYIELYLPNEVGYCYDILVESGYTKVKVELYTDIKECNDGYQHFYLFEGNFSKGDTPLKKYVYEHVPYSCGSNWGTIGEGYGAESAPLDMGTYKLENLSGLKKTNKFYIAFGSGGNAENDWRFRNLKVKLTFSKC